MHATPTQTQKAFPITAAVSAALLLAILPGVSGAQQITLRLDATPGQTHSYRFVQDLDFRMPPEFGGDQQLRSFLLLDQTADRLSGDTIHYRNVVRDISVDMEGSAGAGDLDFSQFEGQTFTSSVTRRGEVVALEMGEGVGVSDQVEHALRQMGFPLLPEAPVRVGQSWTDTTRVDAAAMAVPAEGEIVSISRTTLQGLGRQGGSQVAELRVETTFAFEPGARALPGMRVEMTGNRTDDVRFDVTAGRFLDAIGEQDFVLNMTMPGASGTFAIQGTARSQASLEP